MQVIIIDGNNCLFRFGHVSLNLKVGGKGTGVAYHLLKFLLRAKRAYPQARFVMCWDSTRQCQQWQENWRVKLFPAYKTNRDVKVLTAAEQKTKDFIMAQKDMVNDLMLALGIPYISVAGLEADDLIGIIARQCKKGKWTPIVYSSDKDFLQLICKGITVIRPTPGGKLEEAGDNHVFELFGCTVDDVLKVRAIAGDTGDGIPPAVHRIGTKRAVVLVNDGANPELKTFAEHGQTTQSLIITLKDGWKQVHLNWRIMRILSIPHEKLLGQLNASVLKTNCAGVIDELKRPAVCDYKGLMDLLGRYQLGEAIADRQKLRRIQL